MSRLAEAVVSIAASHKLVKYHLRSVIFCHRFHFLLVSEEVLVVKEYAALVFSNSNVFFAIGQVSAKVNIIFVNVPRSFRLPWLCVIFKRAWIVRCHQICANFLASKECEADRSGLRILLVQLSLVAIKTVIAQAALLEIFFILSEHSF